MWQSLSIKLESPLYQVYTDIVPANYISEAQNLCVGIVKKQLRGFWFHVRARERVHRASNVSLQREFHHNDCWPRFSACVVLLRVLCVFLPV